MLIMNPSKKRKRSGNVLEEEENKGRKTMKIQPTQRAGRSRHKCASNKGRRIKQKLREKKLKAVIETDRDDTPGDEAALLLSTSSCTMTSFNHSPRDIIVTACATAFSNIIIRDALVLLLEYPRCRTTTKKCS
jgi:hypothetical protein